MKSFTKLLFLLVFSCSSTALNHTAHFLLFTPDGDILLPPNPITTRAKDYTGFLPKFHPSSLDKFCDRGYAVDVSDQVGPPAEGEQVYILPSPQEILDQYRQEKNLPFINCAEGYSNPYCDLSCKDPECQPDLSYWSQVVMDSIANPIYKYILLPPEDYSCLGVLNLPVGANNGKRRTLRSLYDDTCSSLSPFDTIHPYDLQEQPKCKTLAKVRNISLMGASNWTIAFLTIGGSADDPASCNFPAMQILGTAKEGPANCNIIHMCVFEHMKQGLRIRGCDDNTVQFCVFKDGFQEPGKDSGGLSIEGGALGAERNVVVGNEFINMNNGIGLPYVNFLSGQQQEIPGTVIVNNDIYFSTETITQCTRDFGDCIGIIDYKCSNSETGIDIKNGTSSPALEDRILILGNRISGYRPTNPDGAGTGGAGEGMVVHNNAQNIFISENILFDNTTGIILFPSKNGGLTKRITIINNLILATQPLQLDPYPFTGVAIAGSTHDTLIVAYNSLFENGRTFSLALNGTYITKCNTFYSQQNECHFRPAPNEPFCCPVPNNSTDSSIVYSQAYLNTWESNLENIYHTGNNYPVNSDGIQFTPADLNNPGVTNLNLGSYTMYNRRWTDKNKKLNLQNIVPYTNKPGPALNLPDDYHPSLPGYCDCAEPLDGSDTTNDPEDLLFLKENIPADCDFLRTPLTETGAGGGMAGASTDTSLSPTPLPMNIEIAPNPTTGSCKIFWTQIADENVRVNLYSTFGISFHEQASTVYPAGAHQLELDLSSAPSGLYILRIQVGEKTQLVKLVRQ